MARVREGDADAFGCLLERYRRRIVAFLFRSVGDGQIAEDLGQDVFARVYLRARTYDEKYPFALWLFRIARNLVIDHLRRRSVPGRRLVAGGPAEGGSREGDADAIEDSSYAPDRELRRKDLQAAIREAVARIPETYRTVFILRDLHDFSYEEIADVTGTTTKTVSSRLARARRVFRELMAPWIVT